MSVVVAIKDKKGVWMGCDSQVTSGMNQNKMIPCQKKIWKPNNNTLIGVVGSLRDINILSTMDNWIDELSELKNEVNQKYVIRNIIPKIFEELKNANRVVFKNNIAELESEIVFSYKNQLYGIDGIGGVIELDDFWATGSGLNNCFGCWNAIKNSKSISIVDKLTECIKSACDNNIYVNYPIHIMNTFSNETITITE